MTFDEKISETIPLSRILDSFIEDDESPEVICTFLEQHYDDCFDILYNSNLSNRIFQIDFIVKCHQKEVDFIHRVIENCKAETSVWLVLCWQILSSNLDKRIKHRFNLKNKELSHVYTRGSKHIQEFDSIFLNDIDKFGNLSDIANKISNEKFFSITNDLNYSLLTNRFLQYDFFYNLNVEKQYIFIKNIFRSIDMKTRIYGHSLVKFIKQILSSDIDSKVKFMVYSEMIKRDWIGYIIGKNLTADEHMEIETSTSYPRLMMTMDLNGIDFIMEDVILKLLYLKKLDILIEMYKRDIELIEKFFDIRNLIEFFMDNHKVKSIG